MERHRGQTPYRDPYDDEQPDYPVRPSASRGSETNLPVISAAPYCCVHCGGAPEFRHHCEEKPNGSR